ncbi:MAG: hypothetical protein ABI743_09830 [bacterium]
MRVGILLCLLLISLGLLTPASSQGTAEGENAQDSFQLHALSTAPGPPSCSPYLFLSIGALDAPLRVDVQTNDAPENLCANMDDWDSDVPDHLFQNIPDPTVLDPSYQATCDLCDQIDLASDSGNYEAIEPMIHSYLSTVAQLPALDWALGISGTTVTDLYQTWFGSAQGFRHVICGEKDQADMTNTGGYHFWYRFYQEERREGDGHVNWRCTLEGEDDPGVATIRFDWDPYGTDDYRKKPIGGFTVGESVGALLALGHLARVWGCDVSDKGNDLVADVNGHEYEWVVVTKDNSLLTLYPKAIDQTLPRPK